MAITVLIIDMDGTITNFNLDYVGARRRALQELERLNLRTPEFNEQVNLYVILNKLKANLDADTFARLRATFYSYFAEMELRAARDVSLYPGAVETLRKLKAESLKLGLVTNNGRVGTSLTLERHHLGDLFDCVVTRDDCEEMKPDGAPIMRVLSELHVEASEAIAIGDGSIDIMAAKAAGVTSVGVSTGPLPRERLLQAGPDYLLTSINDLPTLMERLNPSNTP